MPHIYTVYCSCLFVCLDSGEWRERIELEVVGWLKDGRVNEWNVHTTHLCTEIELALECVFVRRAFRWKKKMLP